MTAPSVHGLLAAALLAAGTASAQAPKARPIPTPVTAPAAAASSAAAPAAPGAVAPSAAVQEKLAQGDRAFVAGDPRAALLAYLDAVYAQPAYVHARLKLGRAYLALRYPAFAIAQAELVLAAEPNQPDALQLIEEARRTPGREIAGAPPAAAPARQAPRTFRLPTPESAAPPPAAAPPAAAGPTAAQRYRTGVELIGNRDYTGAETELGEAIALDPRMAVAYAARASARFGLGRYREAADDYKASLGLDPGLATPLYGLAECYRLLGDPAAAEMYQRYASSKSPDVREDLRDLAARRAQELSAK